MKRHWIALAMMACTSAARSDCDEIIVVLLALACEAHEKARHDQRACTRDGDRCSQHPALRWDGCDLFTPLLGPRAASAVPRAQPLLASPRPLWPE